MRQLDLRSISRRIQNSIHATPPKYFSAPDRIVCNAVFSSPGGQGRNFGAFSAKEFERTSADDQSVEY